MTTFLQRLREDSPTLILLAALLVLTSTSVVLADWTESVRGLTSVTLLALLAGYLLARSAFSELNGEPGASRITKNDNVIITNIVGIRPRRRLTMKLPI